MSLIPKQYSVELRNKDGELKEKLESYLPRLSWEWLRHGGCGRCKIELAGDLSRIVPESLDQLLIYLPVGSGDAELVYRGIISDFERRQDGKKSSLAMDFVGPYQWWSRRIVVHDDVSEKIYRSFEVSAIAEDIFDNFIQPNAPFTKGTIEEGSFAADILAFKGYVNEIFATLASLQGRIFYGINENLEFYWINESDDVGANSKWHVGEHISKLRDRTDFERVVNDIFLEGGSVGEGDSERVFTMRLPAQDHIDLFGVSQRIESQGNIISSGVGSRYMSNLIEQQGIPARQVTAELAAYSRRIESSLPIGRIQIIDPAFYQDRIKYRDAADPQVITYGVGNYVYGEAEEFYVDNIKYEVDGGRGVFNVSVQFGDSQAESQASTRLKKMDQVINATRQRSL